MFPSAIYIAGTVKMPSAESLRENKPQKKEPKEKKTAVMKAFLVKDDCRPHRVTISLMGDIVILASERIWIV